ncbi:MAG: hypothetical protein RMN52_03880 [Anaerolineae bacterium]|nr:hypothetical protein [Candidatus Roseilinea sp.]MDW8449121.1 hypothetical protein [Anaerolineae bacterium]
MNASNEMSRMTSGRPAAPADPRQGGVIAAVMLIAIGVLLLIAQVFQLGWLSLLVTPLLGVAFIVWSIAARTPGLMIPGGILAGLGAGILLMTQPFISEAQNDLLPAAVLMLSFAVGWLLIVVLTPLAGGRLELWPLIPGAVFAVLGALFWMGEPGMRILQVVGTAWPLILIIVGAGILISILRRNHR